MLLSNLTCLLHVTAAVLKEGGVRIKDAVSSASCPLVTYTISHFLYRNLYMSASNLSAVERGCYRYLNAWGGKKGNGLSDLCK